MISLYRFWQRNSSPAGAAALNQVITVNNVRVTIIGVTARRSSPRTTQVGEVQDLTMPLAL